MLKILGLKPKFCFHIYVKSYEPFFHFKWQYRLSIYKSRYNFFKIMRGSWNIKLLCSFLEPHILSPYGMNNSYHVLMAQDFLLLATAGAICHVNIYRQELPV